ncbi:MAG: hypothetical protein Q8P01_02570 [bacterium]|nr:hypothetical protein [bacterium]
MNIKIAIGAERKKLLLQIISIVLLVFLLLVFGDTAREWWGRRQADKAVEGLKQFEAEATARMMADTAGGETPQETLQMYIDAVEKGDFELASKYFVENEREKWRKELEGIALEEKMLVFLDPLKQALISPGEYSADEKSFSILDPVGVDFVLYPNGVWKIVEI